MVKIAVNNGANLELPVAYNSNAILPTCLAMSWLSIERVSISLQFLSEIAIRTGQQIQGRSRDFAHWFKRFHTTNPEH